MTSNITRWLPVALLCLALWPAQAPAQQESWETYMRAGGAAYRRGNYTEAEKQIKAAIRAAKAFGTQDPHFATSLNNLAELYRAQGKYAAAEPLHKRALAIREKALGPEHPNVAQSLENYAGLLARTGRGNEAEGMKARAKAIRAANEKKR